MMKVKIIVGAILGVVFTFSIATGVYAYNYGQGAYGTCEYNTCSISLSSLGNVNLPVAPTVAGRCTIAGDTVSVSTGASTGYTLTLSSSTNETALLNGSSRIEASSGSVTSPTALVSNRWGFRVDSGNFGTGPTSTVQNVAIPATTFSGIPALSSPVTIFAPTTARPSPDNTNVWYGICVDTTRPSGSYSGSVTYTAVIN